MRDLNSIYITEKNKQENSPVRLYEIEDYDGLGTNLYLAENDEDVLFGELNYLTDKNDNYITDKDGNRILANYVSQTTYVRFPILCDRISENSQSQIDTVRLVLANISQLIQGYLHQYDFRGKKVTIKTVWSNILDDEDVILEDIYYVDSYVADIKNVTFTLSSKFDVMDVELPFGRYARTYCRWKFKSTECGYAGAETSCNRTLQRCRVLLNTSRIGATPSVPMRRLYI
jgi:phage-related protein